MDKKTEPENKEEDWAKTKKKWKSFEKTILYGTYSGEFDNNDDFDEWYNQARPF